MGELEFKIHISQLQERYKLPKDFISSLKKEDDWSFIIKLHALFEASLASLITECLGRKELMSFMSRLDISAHPIGKLAVVDSLKLLDEKAIAFIKKLSELRNQLVHNIEQVSFDLKQYLGWLDDNQRNSFIKTMGYDLKEADKMKDEPKLYIWVLGITLLCKIQEKEFTIK